MSNLNSQIIDTRVYSVFINSEAYANVDMSGILTGAKTIIVKLFMDLNPPSTSQLLLVDMNGLRMCGWSSSGAGYATEFTFSTAAGRSFGGSNVHFDFIDPLNMQPTVVNGFMCISLTVIY